MERHAAWYSSVTASSMCSAAGGKAAIEVGAMSETIPCTTMFSNGMEFEWFIEHNCENGCTRFRNGRCKTYNACWNARWDEKYFPYDDLLDFASHNAGKVCKRFTDNPIEKKRRDNPINGQMELIKCD